MAGGWTPGSSNDPVMTMEGMNPNFDPIEPQWNSSVLRWNGQVMSHHDWPVETFVHVVDLEGGCVCGPEVTAVEHSPGRFIRRVEHKPLDPRYYTYDW